MRSGRHIRRHIRRSSAGFSLLEVLVTVAILSAAAYVALDAVDHDSSQLRYDLTETRLKTIRRAIVGDPSLTLNGSPMISGYVADVGQLPPCLQALLVREPDCNSDEEDPGPTVAPPEYGPLVFRDGDAGGNNTLDPEDTVLLSFGWRGPYITGSEQLSDAWGNTETAYLDELPKDPVDENNPHQFREAGLNVSVTFEALGGGGGDVANELLLTSLGRDRLSDDDDGETSNLFDADKSSPAITTEDFLVPLDTLQIQATAHFLVGNEPDFDICFAVLEPDRSLSNATSWRFAATTIETFGANTDGEGATVAGDVTAEISFGVGAQTTLGARTIIAFQTDDPDDCDTESNPLTDNDLDGEVDPAELSMEFLAFRKMIFAPRTALGTISMSFEAPVSPTPEP